VVGLDIDYFSDCTLVPDLVEIPTIRKDLRDVTAKDLVGFDAVIHLAALSNDPIGNLNEAWTRDINSRGTIRLAKFAKQAGVSRFIFSSSCIMYGMSEAVVVDENAPLAPQTEYARSKVDAETALRRLADDRFSPTFCRNGTVYGLSPRMRFDTVLNNLMGSAFTTGRVVIHSDGTPWRPVVHVEDVARAFLAVLQAPLEIVHNEAYNIGADELNHRISELGQIVAETVPGCELATMPQPGIDHLARIPTIVLDPKVTHTSRLARVHITTAVTGVSAPGTAYRMDEIPLPLRPALVSPYPTDEEVLRRIHAAVAAKPAWSPATNVQAAIA